MHKKYCTCKLKRPCKYAQRLSSVFGKKLSWKHGNKGDGGKRLADATQSLALKFVLADVGVAKELKLQALDARYRLADNKDYEVRVAFLQLAIQSWCQQYFGEVDKASRN